jgi:hypothetical protein
MLTIIKVSEDKLPKVENGYCKGYKVIRNDNHSLYFDHLFTTGENISNRTCKCATKECRDCKDINDGFVAKGFHLFTSIDKANKFQETCVYVKPEPEHFVGQKIIEVFYKPEDIISYGLVGSDLGVVVMKMEVKSLEVKGE